MTRHDADETPVPIAGRETRGMAQLPPRSRRRQGRRRRRTRRRATDRSASVRVPPSPGAAGHRAWATSTGIAWWASPAAGISRSWSATPGWRRSTCSSGCSPRSVFFVATMIVGWTTFASALRRHRSAAHPAGVRRDRPALLGRTADGRLGRHRHPRVDRWPRPAGSVSGPCATPIDGSRSASSPSTSSSAPAIGSIAVGAYTAAPSFIFNSPFDLGSFLVGPIVWLSGVAFGALMLGAAPRLAVLLARFKAHVTAFFLGPDQLAEVKQRVSTLSTQRQDILDAVASERRRIERNLHDGVQQQLVAIGLDLGMAEQHIDADPVPGPRARGERPAEGAGFDR